MGFDQRDALSLHTVLDNLPRRNAGRIRIASSAPGWIRRSVCGSRFVVLPVVDDVPRVWSRISSGRRDLRNASAKLSMELGLARSSGSTSAFPIFAKIGPGPFDIAGADDDGCPRFRKNARRLQADPGVAASHKGDLSTKVAAAKRVLAGRLRSKSRSKRLLLGCHWCAPIVVDC
jgi:hypothetical protein